MTVTAIAPWFGSNRMLAEHVGRHLAGCEWVAVPFAGGMAELPHIPARTVVVNDLHRRVMNLASVIATDETIESELENKPFHPDVLAAAQAYCRDVEAGASPDPREWAIQYFVAVWMGRSGKAGTDDEFKGKLALRWEAGGGDSAKRYQSAVEAIGTFRQTMRRCTFSTLDAFEFLDKCKDRPRHGIYCDPPFPGPGDAYKHKIAEAGQRRLAGVLAGFRQCRVVCRFYDHAMIRELYPETLWTWDRLRGRDQANGEKPEVLIVSKTFNRPGGQRSDDAN
jgi:DNA adenine methylase